MSEPAVAIREQPAPPLARRRRTLWREYAESLLVTILLVLFGTSFVVQAYKIPSRSMEQTLLVGDHLLVNKFVYGGRGAWYEKFLPYREVRRGDIVVFKQMLLHRSTPNFSDQIRWTAQLRITDLADPDYRRQRFPTGDRTNIFYVDYPGHDSAARRAQEHQGEANV